MPFKLSTLCRQLEHAVTHGVRGHADGSPNVLISVLLARAIRRMDPDSEKTVTAVVALDHKAQLGSRENYRMFVDTAIVDMPKAQADYDRRPGDSSCFRLSRRTAFIP